MKVFDIENWNRKAQFEFFKTYEDPFFNISANLNSTNLYHYCKKENLSFSLACIYVALKCMNEISEFKLRLKDGIVYLFDNVDIGSTILNDDHTFSFCYFKNQSTLSAFVAKAKEVIEQHGLGVPFEPKEEALDIVHCTTIPWVSFAGFKHAKKGDEGQKGIPKIVFGKLFADQGIKKIPFSVEVHHALMDGFHVSQLFESMQVFMDDLK